MMYHVYEGNFFLWFILFPLEGGEAKMVKMRVGSLDNKVNSL
jgi:hypothetical protein